MSNKLLINKPNQARLCGEINFADVDDLLRDFKQHLAFDSQIEVDLSALKNGKTLILSLMLEMRRIATAQNTAISFSHIPTNLQNIAKLNGVAEFIL